MKKFVMIFCLIIAATQISVSADTINMYDLNKLDAAERMIFGNNNRYDNAYVRLETAEKELFGTIQPGSFSSRTDLINRAATERHYQNTYENNRKRNAIVNGLNSLMTIINGGTQTGFTPAPYDPFIQSQSYTATSPYNTHQYSTNGITGVRVILDN